MLTAEQLNARSTGTLAGLIGLKILTVEQGRVTSRLEIRPELLAANGFLHAATVVALADTTSGYGTFAHLPDGVEAFTTIELKINFVGTARDGFVTCEATLLHAGRTTQVWDAVVKDGKSGRTIALFRCTQILLNDRSSR